jgi:ATP-dependent protease ClpP protease subunit
MSARHTRRGFLAAHKLAAKAGIRVPRGVAAGATAEQPQDGDEHGRDRPWYSVTNATANEAELMLYDDIGGWYGTYAEDFDADLKAITAPKLTVRLNSPGGSVFEGMAIASMLRSHPADITVRVDGIAASIASVIAMAGDRVVMMPGATMMIHDASGVCLGDAAEMAKMAELLDLLSDNIADIYAARAGGTRDEWRERMRAESWYLAQEAVDAGLADEVAAARGGGDEAPEMRQAWDLTAYGYAGRDVTGQADDGQTSLTINIGSALGQQLVAALRNTIQPEPTEAEPAATEQPVQEPVAAAVPLPEPEPVHEHPTDDLTWADLTAHLTQPEPDPWAQLVANLTTDASSSAATDA